MKIKRNDIVVMITGSQKSDGKTGKVLKVMKKQGRALVEGMRLIKRHLRKSQNNPKGGIVSKESPVSLSNLMLFCPHCKQGAKVIFVMEGDKKTRSCKVCKHRFDA